MSLKQNCFLIFVTFISFTIICFCCHISCYLKFSGNTSKSCLLLNEEVMTTINLTPAAIFVACSSIIGANEACQSPFQFYLFTC